MASKCTYTFEAKVEISRTFEGVSQNDQLDPSRGGRESIP